MWLKAFQCVRGGCRQTKLCLQASSQKEKKHCSTMWLTRTSSDDDIGLVCLFTKHSLIILQAVLPRRADPTELKAIFEKVGFDLYVLFSFLSLPSFKEGFLPSFDLGFFSFFKWISKAQPCVFIFYKKMFCFTVCQRQEEWEILHVGAGLCEPFPPCSHGHSADQWGHKSAGWSGGPEERWVSVPFIF